MFKVVPDGYPRCPDIHNLCWGQLWVRHMFCGRDLWWTIPLHIFHWSCWDTLWITQKSTISTLAVKLSVSAIYYPQVDCHNLSECHHLYEFGRHMFLRPLLTAKNLLPSTSFKDVRYNKAWKMLIFTCDAPLLQQLTRSPLKFIGYYLILLKIMVFVCFIEAQSSLQCCTLGYRIILP